MTQGSLAAILVVVLVVSTLVGAMYIHSRRDQLDDGSSAGLLGRLQSDNPDVVSHAIIQAGDSQHAEAEEPLLALLDSPDAKIRKECIWALGQLGSKKALPKIVAALDDPDLRGHAALALGQIGDPTVVPRLVELIEQEPKPGDTLFRGDICRALGQIVKDDETAFILEEEALAWWAVHKNEHFQPILLKETSPDDPTPRNGNP